MSEQVRFLRDAASKLRELAMISPEVAEQLRGLAAELETEANRLEQQPPSNAR